MYFALGVLLGNFSFQLHLFSCEVIDLVVIIFLFNIDGWIDFLSCLGADFLGKAEYKSLKEIEQITFGCYLILL